jgi:hypothetical protein
MQELGFTKSHIDVASHTDLSFIEAAGAAYRSHQP